jgi:hemerythrin-like domain-containing protein
MTILDSLARDHRALERMLTDLAATPSSDGAHRIAVFSRLQALLQSHARAEEEVVYRRLQQTLPDEVKTLEAFEEHHVADLLLQELASACPGGPGWTAKTRVFEELLRHHIKEEELDLFALIRANFDEAAQAQMAAEFQALKHERVEALLAPIRRATPAFAGRATIYAQAAAGRFVRRGELYVRRALQRLRA